VASVLVTGATGFVGRVVTRELIARGHDVRVLLRGPDPEQRAEAAFGGSVTVFAAELRDPSSLRAAPRDCDAVVHLAATVDPALQENEDEVGRVNRDGAIALALAARDAGVRTFVFTSSIAAMGFRPGRATTATPCHPETAEHGITRLATPDFRVVTLRPPTIYGPGERYNFLAWVRAVDAGVFRIIGKGNNIFPLCATENVSRAVAASVERRVPAGTFLIADSEEYAMGRIHGAILTALGRPAPRLRIPAAVALVLGTANELLLPLGVPLRLSRSRVRTLTTDLPFDVTPLLAAGVPLDAPLEAVVARTIADYRAHGLLR
jgi:nucleoside-diphosphate-sugar epimerase